MNGHEIGLIALAACNGWSWGAAVTSLMSGRVNQAAFRVGCAVFGTILSLSVAFR